MLSNLSVNVLDVGTGIAGKPEALGSLLHHQKVGTIWTKEMHRLVRGRHCKLSDN